MRFENGIAEGIAYERAKNIGGTIVPEVVVLHDTAGRLDKFNSAKYLLTAPRGVSVHFVIERDGTVTQQVPINRRAGHAGRSHYHGRDDVNAFSVGIELVNPGKMTAAGDGLARAWFKQEFNIVEYQISQITTTEHGSGLWMEYTRHQISAVEHLLNALFDVVETLSDIVPHWYVSPGRKTDTNPLFPLDQIKARVLGREDPAVDVADDHASHVGAACIVQINTKGSNLNMRRWPSFNPNVIASIPDEARVPVLREGEFDGRAWLKVGFGGLEGWVVKSLTTPATT